MASPFRPGGTIQPALACGQSEAQPGDTVPLHWSDVPVAALSSDNWIGLYAVGALDSVPCAAVFTGGTSPGGTDFGLPASLLPGAYEFRLWAAKGPVGRLATSNGLRLLDGSGQPRGVITGWGLLSAAMAPGATVRGFFHLDSPASTDRIDVVAVGSSTGLTGGRYLYGAADGYRDLVLPTSTAQGFYQIALWSGTSGQIVALGPPFYVPVTVPKPACQLDRVWDTLRNNGSAQRFNYLMGPADSAAIVHVNAVGDAEGAAPPLTGTLPNAGGVGWDGAAPTVYVDLPLTPSNISPGTYEGRLYEGGSSVRLATTAPFTVTA
jgi:hypothetical protein